MNAVFEAMLFNEETADVTFIVGEEETARIPAHAAVLSAATDVFKQMFYGRFDREREVRVPDCRPDAFRLFLRHVYTGLMELNHETAVGVAFVAKKYMAASTYDAAVTFLTNDLSKERVCELLKCLPSLGLLEEVGGTFWNTFDREAEAILRSPEFLNVNYETLREIVERDTICARETTVYWRTVAWAKEELRRQPNEAMEIADEDIRELLGDVIHLIRFPTMTIEEFSQGAARSGILTHEEKVDIFLHLTNAATAALFDPNPRCVDGMLVCRACGTLGSNNSTNICANCNYDEDYDVRRMTLQVPFTTIIRGPQQVEVSISNYLRNSALRNVTATLPAQGNGHNIACPVCGAPYAVTSGACSQCKYNKTTDSRQLQVRVKCCQQYCDTYLTITADIQNYLSPSHEPFFNSAASPFTAQSSGSNYCDSCARSLIHPSSRDSHDRSWRLGYGYN